jgi:hypothetical protein
MQHPLKWARGSGLLAEALGVRRDDPALVEIEATVERALKEKWNMIRLFQHIGRMDISDELWANFLYTFGYWQGQRN